MGGNWDGEHRRNYFLYGGDVKHPFFDAIDDIERSAHWNVFEGSGNYPRKEFYRELKQAHAFVFDKKCSTDAMVTAGGIVDDSTKMTRADLSRIADETKASASKVEEFSLPFKTCLYLLKDAPRTARMHPDDKNTVKSMYTRLGYLIKEVSPEAIRVFDILLAEHADFPDGRVIPIPDFFTINLKDEADRFSSDIVAINRLTNMISVKRIGIEVDCQRTLKTKGIGAGFTTFKFDRLYHIADKEEYQYSLGDGDINFEFAGWWRGHWRAFYCKDSNGKHVRDSFGRNIVDYNRIGKDRAGDYNTPGYTWVKEHIKGDPDLAQIKTHYVVNK